MIIQLTGDSIHSKFKTNKNNIDLMLMFSKIKNITSCHSHLILVKENEKSAEKVRKKSNQNSV
jgi:hypothetical protein